MLILSVKYAATRLEIENEEMKVLIQEREAMDTMKEHFEKADKERERYHEDEIILSIASYLEEQNAKTTTLF